MKKLFETMNKQQELLDPALNHVPDMVNTIHIMGICGTAMAAIAGMLKERGFTITGSDAHVYPPMSEFLAKIGVQPFNGYASENLAHNPDLVIVGNVITRTNPEAVALAASQIPYVSMPQALAHFFITSRRSLVLAGTHGKTTTSSMLASALDDMGGDPTFMIGGIVQKFSANYRIGSGPYFVAEGDEYDTAFFDKVSKFLHYHPEVAVITSLEFDHADIFANLEAIKDSFRNFVKLVPVDGLIIANFDDENVVEVVKEASCTIQSYGTSEKCNWRIAPASYSGGYTLFSLFLEEQHFAEMAIKSPGMHNCMNSTAVAAVLHHLGYDSDEIVSSLRSFGGVKRRQEIKGVINNITVIDDFAHHPTAVRETLSALKCAYPVQRLIAVFEPRTNTSRRSFFQQHYVESFLDAELSLIREPQVRGDTDGDDCFSSARLATDLCQRNRQAFAYSSTDDILTHLDNVTQPGDVIVILSNGGFDNIHDRLLRLLREKESA